MAKFERCGEKAVGRASSSRDATVARLAKELSSRDATVAKQGSVIAKLRKDAKGNAKLRKDGAKMKKEIARLAKELSSRDATVAKQGSVIAKQGSVIAKLRKDAKGNAKLRKDGAKMKEIAKLKKNAGGSEIGRLNEEFEKQRKEIGRLKEQACGKAHGGSPCPYGEDVKRLGEELAQARKTNSALSARNLRIRPNARGKKGAAAAAKKGAAAAAKKGAAKDKKGDGKEDAAPRKRAPRARAEPDRIVRVEEDECRVCGSKLSGPVGMCPHTVEKRMIVKKIVRYDKVTKYCSPCGTTRTPATPGALPGSGFDIPITMMAVCLRMTGMSHRNIRLAFRTTLGLDIALGTIVKMVNRVAAAFWPLYVGMLKELRKASLISADETPWRVDGRSAWLWAFVSGTAAAYAIRDTRGASVPEAMLEGFEGILSSDSLGSYNSSGGSHQKCQLHYLREIRETLKYKEPGGEFKRFARTLKKILLDSRDAAELRGKGRRKLAVGRLLARVDRLISRGYAEPDCRRFVKRLRRERDHLFTFVVAGIPYHNNTAERAVRPGVIARKISGGSRSWKGAESQSILMSVKETCRLRGVDFYEFGIEYLSGGTRALPGAEAADAGKTASKS